MAFRTIRTKTTYLEMRSPPSGLAERRMPDGACIESVESPGLDRYRQWYRRVGQEYHWVDRLLMPDTELGGILKDPRVEFHVLKVDGEAAGYSELDRRVAEEIELAYFGLFPEFVGRGLGRPFLEWTLNRAWSRSPRRVWVHTCDLDHPAALPNYLNAGFVIYDQCYVDQPIPVSNPGSAANGR